MKTSLLYSLFAVIVFSCCNVSISQTQMRNWVIPPNQADVSNPIPTITSISSGVSVTHEANGIYDANNNLMFYCSDDNIYKAGSSTAISPLGDNATHIGKNEIAIVPFMDNDACNKKKYYVFFIEDEPIDFGPMELWATVIDMSSGSPVVVSSNYRNTPYTIWTDKFDGSWGGIAVGKNVGGKRYVYVMRSHLERFTISVPDASNNFTGISDWQVLAIPGSFDYHTMEMDLSPDGKWLAWGSLHQFPTLYNYNIIGLTASTGNFNNIVKQFNVGIIDVNRFMGRGVEFDATSTKLFVGAGSDGVFYVPVNNTSSQTRITNSDVQGLGFSQLELAQNGFIYAAKSNVAIPIDPVNNIIGPTNSNISSITPGKNNNGGFFSNWPDFFTLPDQIDGENYSSFNITPLAYTATSFTAPNTPPIKVWTMQSNDITGTSNPPVIRIQTKLTIPTGLTLAMGNMFFEFGPNATLEVQKGAQLILDNTLLAGVQCNSMWQGIIVDDGGNLVMNNSGNTSLHPVIRDAKIAIDAGGTNAKVNLSNAQFNANGTHLRLTNVSGSNIRTVGCAFSHMLPLKDQFFGQQLTGVQDNGAYKGKTSIEILNTTSTVIIGDPSSSAFKNAFNRGQYGIKISNSYAAIQQNNFNTILNTAIEGDGSGGNKSINVTDKNIFNSVTQGIYLHNGVNSTIQGNTFNNGIHFGIFWQSNNNRQLIIGGNSSGQKNIFNNNNWAAIMAQTNGGAQIKIIGNDFNGAPYADGIVVQEWALSSSKTFQLLDISNNIINNIGNGIKLNNIRGDNNSYSLILSSSSSSNIKNNTINFVTTFSSSTRGIQATNSPGLRINENNIASDNPYGWMNSGINATDCEYSLVHDNTVQAGKGIHLVTNVRFSHIYCNTLSKNVIGTQLASTTLRNPVTFPSQVGDIYTHGTVNSPRDNSFSNAASWGGEVELFNSDANQYSTIKRYNQWFFKTGKVPNIMYTGCAASISNTTSANGPCENIAPPPDSSKNVRAFFVDSVQQWKADYEYYVKKLQTHEGNSDVIDFIKKVVKVEDAIGQGNYVTANGMLAGLHPSFSLETYLKQVLGIIIAYHYPVARPLTDNEISILTNIASLNSINAGPAVFSARAVMKVEFNKDFIDDEITGRTIVGNVALTNNCSSNNVKNISIGILDNNNNVQTNISRVLTDSNGRFVFDPYQLRLLDTTQLFGFYLDTNKYIIDNPEFKTIREWVSGGLFTLGISGKNIVQAWSAIYNGPANAGDGGKDIAVDDAGNVYVTGSSTGIGSGLDFLTIKYNSAGDTLWTRRYNGSGNGEDRANALVLNKDGNIYVTGKTFSSNGDFDFLTLKYDNSGNLQWVKTHDGTSGANDEAKSIAVDGSGNVYVTGDADNAGTGEDYTTIKYDASGNELWVQAFDGTGRMDNVSAIAVDASGNSYITGCIQMGPNLTDMDFATLKYDANGNVLWTQTFNGSANGNDMTNALALDASNNVIVTGFSQGDTSGLDIATIKYDTDGNQLWLKKYNGPANLDDAANAIAVDKLGNIYITGANFTLLTLHDFVTLKYDAGGSQLWVQHYHSSVAVNDIALDIALDDSSNAYVTGYNFTLINNNHDYATIKYSTDGVRQWVEHFNGSQNADDGATAIAVDKNSNVYVTGITNSGFSLTYPQIASQSDYATVKYIQCDQASSSLRTQQQNNNSAETKQPEVSASQSTISIYPNPSNGSMTIKYSLEQTQQARFEIYDVVGVKIASYLLPSEANTLSVSENNFQEGVYFYRVVSVRTTHASGGAVIVSVRTTHVTRRTTHVTRRTTHATRRTTHVTRRTVISDFEN
ncbi:MAG: SBBP repeat-containing protein [Bacteroidetes bacterium]|nr:SBBP repeat-containing protein [Bacteroidota bacterium]